MKRTLVLLAATLLAAPALAHDYDSDLMCQIVDTAGQVNHYTFANNSVNSAGNIGTYVETGYSSDRKGFVSAPAGNRPIWVYSDNGSSIVIELRENQGWAIVLSNIVKRGQILGGQRRQVIGSPPAWSVSAARKEAGELRHRVDSGEDPQAEKEAGRAAPDVRELAERFKSEFLPSKRPSTAADYRALIDNHVLPALGAMKVADVTFADVDRLHRSMRETPYRANRCAAVLSKMFSLSIDGGSELTTQRKELSATTRKSVQHI